MEKSNRVLTQGIIISKVACHNERYVHANREGLDIDKVPLKYGSLRLVVNVISTEGRTYSINKRPSNPSLKEERLIMEISYRFDKEGRVVEEHDIINSMNTSDECDVILNRTFITNKHYCKLIPSGEEDKMIKTYFIKAWADDIYFFDEPGTKVGKRKITPCEVMSKLDVANVLQLT